MEKTGIDAVKMTREIRDAHHDQLLGKPWNERVAFFQEQARKLHGELQRKKTQGTQEVCIESFSGQ